MSVLGASVIISTYLQQKKKRILYVIRPHNTIAWHVGTLIHSTQSLRRRHHCMRDRSPGCMQTKYANQGILSYNLQAAGNDDNDTGRPEAGEALRMLVVLAGCLTQVILSLHRRAALHCRYIGLMLLAAFRSQAVPRKVCRRSRKAAESLAS